MASLEDIAALPGFGPAKIESFEQAGYESLDDLRGVTWDELGEIRGIQSAAKRRAVLTFLEEHGLRDSPATEETYDQFKTLLAELFQFESADLDFGVYRILNERRDQIATFLEDDLQERVRTELQSARERRRADARERLERSTERIRADCPGLVDNDGHVDEAAFPDDPQGTLGERIDDYLAAKQAVQHTAVDEDTEAVIYQDLYRFFRRYYDDGDFVPQRRTTSEATYAIPYNGEEVTLHWANKEQYFVKTGERFTDYRFQTESYDVEFRLHRAHVEKSNRKGEEKHFVLRDRTPIEQEDRQAVVHFEYRPLTDGDFTRYDLSERSRTKAEDIQTGIEQEILGAVDANLATALTRDTDSAYSSSTVLQKHLTNYRTKHESDYFIHKDLGGFLRRELDFYLKDELYSWSELTDERGGVPATLRARLNAVENVATEIIDVIAQIEDFQKRLYEKTKFVTNTEYCFTLDTVPAEKYPEILDTDEQLAEWRALYNIDNTTGPARSSGDSIDQAYLETHQSMMVDTRYFSTDFTLEVLAEMDDIAATTDGLLLNGENYQSLDVLGERFENEIDLTYIDPPYNTGNSFPYKDSYRHSSWLSMMADRVGQVDGLSSETGLLFASIDDNEFSRLRLLLDDIFGESQRMGPVVVQVNKGGRNYVPIAKTHEYLAVAATGEERDVNTVPKQDTSAFKFEDSRGTWTDRGLRNRNPKFDRENRPNLYYPIYVDEDRTNEYGHAAVSLEPDEECVEIYPQNSAGGDDCWRWGQEKLADNVVVGDTDASDVLAKQRRDGTWKIVEKYRDKTTQVKSLWDTPEMRTERGTITLRNLFGESGLYAHPKPTELVRKVLVAGSDPGDTVLDFFAGSGTTAQAAIELASEGEPRDYVLVEMAAYFEDLLLPRIKKSVYASEWDDGSPVDRNSLSHVLKYQTIEEYEDTLANLDTGDEQARFDEFTGDRLAYYLDVELDGPSLLDLDGLRDPFDYRMTVRDGEGRSTRAIDLVETVNYLLGLSMRQLERYDKHDREYRIVTGTRDDETVAVVWRPIRDDDGVAFFEDERDFLSSVVLDDEDVVYINHDSALADARSIERAIQHRMWE